MAEAWVRAASPVALALALLLAAAFPLPAEGLKAVEVGYYDAKPSCFRDAGGNPGGIFIDVLEAVARREGWELHYHFETWNRLLEGLKGGGLDLVPAIVLTPEREGFAVFTRESVMTDWGAVFSRTAGGPSSILDLDMRKVGALENDFWFSGPGSLKSLCASFNIHPDYVFFMDYPSLFKALESGSVDAAVGSNSLGISSTPHRSILATSIVYNPIELRFAASRASPGGVLLARELDTALASIRADSPEVFSAALAKYQVPLRREFRAPRWLLAALAATILVLIVVVILLIAQRRALRSSQLRLRGIFEDSPVAIWEEDFSLVKQRIDAARASGVVDWAAHFAPLKVMEEYVSLVRILDVNRAALELIGAEEKKELTSTLVRIFGAEGLEALRPEFIALAQGHFTYEGEAVHVNSRGERVDVQFKLSVMPGFEQSWSRVLITTLDVSEKTRAVKALTASLAEKKVLLREVHHRVKNNMQVISSIISLQSFGAGEGCREISMDTQARIRSMAQLHELLYGSEDLASIDPAEYLRAIASEIDLSYGRKPIRVEAQSDALTIDEAILKKPNLKLGKNNFLRKQI